MASKLAGGIKAGTTSYSTDVVLINAADGTELTGKIFSDVTAYYWRQGGSPTQITLKTLAAINSTFDAGGFKEAEATNMKGSYRLDVPDAALAAGAEWVEIDAFCTGSLVYKERFALETQGAAEVYTLLGTVQTAVGAIKTVTDTLTVVGGKITAQIVAAGDLAQAAADKVWLTTSRTLSAFGFSVTLANDVWEETASSHNTAGTTGALLNAAASAGDPWQTNIPGAYTGVQAGKVVGDALDAAITTRAAASALSTMQGNVTTIVSTTGAIKTVTDQLTIAGGKVAAQILLAADFAQGAADKVWASAARLLTGYGTLVTDITTAIWAASVRTLSAFNFNVSLSSSVWDESAAAHNTAGTTGNKLNAAASAGDPWSTIIPGPYTVGQAGYVLGNQADNTAAIATIQSQTSQIVSPATTAAAVWNQVMESEGNYTAKQVQSILFSVLAGVTSSNGTVLKTPNGAAVRVAAVVNQLDERTQMTLTPSA